MLAARQSEKPSDPTLHVPVDPDVFEGDAAKDGVRLTPKAIEMAKKALVKRGTPDASLRLGVRGGGCSGVSYAIEFSDKIRSRDNVYEFDGLRVIVDPKSLVYLRGSVLDYEIELMRHGFKFVNPNEKSNCGCGESFTV
ncbi:MAG: iron-sulfur cluster assembly accessory protein [Myxococcales bacterium]|jgi:iron-sulfur cluster assembly protein